MRPSFSSLTFDALSIVALPAAGALLLGLSSQSPSAHMSQPPSAYVTIAPAGVQSPLSNITMTQENLQWDAPSIAADASQYPSGSAAFPLMLDAIDANGQHYGGFGTSCVPRSATVVHCTLYYPAVRHHAPWATIVLDFTPAEGVDPITLTVHPG